MQRCFRDLFRFEISKEVLLTPLARRLATAWPALSKHGQHLQLYFVVRHPLDFTSSLLEHLGLDTNVSFEDQHFFWAPGHFPRHFTPGKQRYLDHSALGLRFSGYLDASIQRWALVVDEYLQCPQDFALVRYEDFLADPVFATHQLAKALGLAPDAGAEDRVREAAQVQYQTKRRSSSQPVEEIFEPRMLARLIEAVRTRFELFGYHAPQNLQAVPADWPAIDLPPLVGGACDKKTPELVKVIVHVVHFT
ncbi:unnamed protein product [Durusdinium trenchii]|uniref:Sulfotransferase n=1 Tax=Durusdinium trenchii TaxID=1381693 RepID=A0ABP0HPD7_9DINO